MAKKGVARIIGETSPKVGTKLTYHVAEWHSGTSQSERNPANVNWQLYKENSNGSFDKVNLLVKGEQGFTFKWSAINKKFKLVGYLYQPEMSTSIEIRPQAGERSISRISFLDVNGNKLTQTPKYGQTLKIVIETINMFAETLHVSLWERDTMSDSGHDPNDNTKLWGEKEYVVDFESGKVIFDIMLSPVWAVQANKSLFEGGEHEFYLLVRGDGARTKYSVQQNLEDKEVLQQPSTGNSTPTSSQPSSTNNQPPVSSRPQPRPQTPNNGSQPASGNTEIQEPLKVENQAGANPVEGSGRTVTTVNEQKVEGLIDAYFAKKEYTKKTGEEAGTLEYEVKSNGNKTSTDAEKEKIAKIIFDKPAVKALTEKKEYTTVEAIKEKLTKEIYNNGDKITITTFKLGEEFKKITSAPLEDKVYLVTTSYLLEGKEAKIIIKEKDGIIKGSADAAFPVLELTEAQMEQSEPLKEEERNEKSEFKGTFKDDIVKIPIQLRPKSDEELAQWKEKIAKGKEEGEYTYTFNNENGTTINDDNKKRLSGIIVANAKEGKLENPKIEEGKTAYAEDVEGKLESKIYTKGESITFPLYKKVTEMLWLDVSCDGDLASYKEEFLKKEGAYFEIGKKCECEERIRAFMRVIRIAEGTGEYVKGTKTPRDPQLGYTTWFSGGGNNFTLSDDHPRVINSNSTNTLRSSAAGAYQFMSWKFDELNGKTVIFKNGYFQTAVPEIYTEASDKAKKYDAKGFDEIAQDRLCVIILKDIGAITKLLNDDIKGAISTSSGTWVSLPGATAGQPTAKMQETLDYYEEFLKEELAGNSHLHIQKGFLKDFDITCTCGNESSGSWRHPLDRMELRGWYGSGFYPGDSDHGDAEVRFSKHHEGLDLYAPVGTEVYACVDGEIYEDYISGTYGNTLGIKGTYNGETYYFFYAHLSERSVAKGDKVTAGDPIGKTGQSGNASGQAAKMDHLHFEVRTTSARTGGRIDPIATIDELKNDVITNPDQTTQTGN